LLALSRPTKETSHHEPRFAPARRNAEGKDGPVSRVLQFRIEIQETSPSIWRRIQVPAGYSFWDLHVAIQDAMGWTDSHLHAFEIVDPKQGRIEIGIPDPDGEADVFAGWTRKLAKHFKKPGDGLVYEYDFGDSWRHTVLLEEISEAEPDTRYPRCIDGARKCPPEDCGGVWGFGEFLKAIADPSHDEHADLLTWVGGSYDPSDFDPSVVHFDDPDERLKALR